MSTDASLVLTSTCAYLRAVGSLQILVVMDCIVHVDKENSTVFLHFPGPHMNKACPAAGHERRRLLLRMQCERLCQGYTMALADGFLNPVLWLVDGDDPKGKELCIAATCSIQPKQTRFAVRSARISSLPSYSRSLFHPARPWPGHCVTRVIAFFHVRCFPPIFISVVVSGGGNPYAILTIPGKPRT
jgi:hypothetical protein